MLWSVLPSLLCLPLLAVLDDFQQPLLCVFCQLLGIGDLWVHVGIHVQEVDAGLVRFVPFLLWDEVPEEEGQR